MTPAELIRTVTGRLREAGVEAPAAEAGWLVRAAFGLTATELHTVDDLPEGCAQESLWPLVERRITREPLQHILGSAPFRHVTVPVGAGVFVPRPETELLVDAVLPALRECAAPLVIDLCSGSGALALALADEVPGARVVAVELPGASGDWLLSNTAGSAVEARIGDVFDPAVVADLAGTADAVVCNPPYVPDSAEVGAEVRFDPEVAVFGGADGLAVIPAVLRRAAEALRAGGVLALEHDDTQGDAVPELLRRTGEWDAVEPHLDLAGRPRFVSARRR